jgi:hypothetical protein
MAARKPYQDTAVSTSRTQEQLDGLLQKRGIHVTRWTAFPDLIRFEFQPKKESIAYRVEIKVKVGYNARESDQIRRAAYRTLFWYVKSKFEATDAGLADLEREFMAYMITGPDRVFYQEVAEAMEHGARSLPLGQDSPLLPEGRGENPANVVEGQFKQAD